MDASNDQDPELHPVILGQSLLNLGDDSVQYHSFKYNFKPDSIDYTVDGQFKVKPDNVVTLDVPSQQGDRVSFSGPRQATKDVEVILIYDEEKNTYTLERLDSMVRLSVHRGPPLRASSVARSSTSNAASIEGSPISIAEDIDSSSPKSVEESKKAPQVQEEPSEADTGSVETPKPTLVSEPEPSSETSTKPPSTPEPKVEKKPQTTSASKTRIASKPIRGPPKTPQATKPAPEETSSTASTKKESNNDQSNNAPSPVTAEDKLLRTTPTKNPLNNTLSPQSISRSSSVVNSPRINPPSTAPTPTTIRTSIMTPSKKKTLSKTSMVNPGLSSDSSSGSDSSDSSSSEDSDDDDQEEDDDDLDDFANQLNESLIDKPKPMPTLASSGSKKGKNTRGTASTSVRNKNVSTKKAGGPISLKKMLGEDSRDMEVLSSSDEG